MLTLKECKDIVEKAFEAPSPKLALIKALRDAQRDAHAEGLEEGFKDGVRDVAAQLRVELAIIEDMYDV